MGSTPDQHAKTMIANMKEKTGKTLEQWVKIGKASKLEKHGQLVKHLKDEHGMTHGFANLVALTIFNPDVVKPSDATADQLVEAQYAGPKSDLRPIYDALIKAVTKFGKDVEVAPKKSYVSLRRSKQFALIQPSTKTRVDVGINLKGEPPTDRLENSGSFNSMVSHRVRLDDPKQVDKQLIAWLKDAYTKA